MIFPIHAGFGIPFHAGSVRVGRGSMIIVLYYIYAYMFCYGHPLNLSTLTLHRPQTFSHLFPHIFHVQYRRLSGHF